MNINLCLARTPSKLRFSGVSQPLQPDTEKLRSLFSLLSRSAFTFEDTNDRHHASIGETGVKVTREEANGLVKYSLILPEAYQGGIELIKGRKDHLPIVIWVRSTSSNDDAKIRWNDSNCQISAELLIQNFEKARSSSESPYPIVWH